MKKAIKRAVIAGLLLFSVSLLEASPQINASRTEASLRSLDEIFPDLSRIQRWRVFTVRGLRNTFHRNEAALFIPSSKSGIDLLGTIRDSNPVQTVEALVVVPYSGRTLNTLDAYNAIGRIQNISNYLVYSSSRDRFIPLFEESTRLDNGQRNRPIPDPPPATRLPASETMYICLRDTFFGNTYFRGNLSTGPHGITYSLTNNTAVWYLVFPVMGAEKFAAILYVEPLREGMLIYSVAGIDIPEFIASRINLAFNIDRRVTIFINWLSDGLRAIR